MPDEAARMSPKPKEDPILQTEDLVVAFPVQRSWMDILKRRPAKRVRAVDRVSFEVGRHETLGLVGESGGGKSTVGRAIVRLNEPTSGRIIFEGEDLETHSRQSLQHLRRHIQMVFQDPYSSLNPRLTVGQALMEVLRFHKVVDRSEMEDRVSELLEVVGLSKDFAPRRPRHLSGGERQRVGLARALAVEPSFIVLDEPVAALDVSIQAQVLNLLQDLRDRFGLAMIFIAHELSVVQHVSDRVAVMYLGVIVELGTTEEIFGRAQHPYTQSLLKAAPLLRPGKRRRQAALKGDIPSPLDVPPGCRFHPRCTRAEKICSEIEPPTVQASPTQTVSCHFPG